MRDLENRMVLDPGREEREAKARRVRAYLEDHWEDFPWEPEGGTEDAEREKTEG